MDIETYFKTLSTKERIVLAEKCNTTLGHLRNVAYGKTCGEKLAVCLERESKKKTTRQELRPKDWHLIWPELVTEEHPIPLKAA